MCVNLKALTLLVFIIANYVETKIYTNCKDLPAVSVNLSTLVDLSPLLLLRSSNPASNCTLGIVIGPLPIAGNKNFTGLMIRGNVVTQVFSVDPTSPTTTAHSYGCSDGINYSNKFLYTDWSEPNPFHIVYACDECTGQLTMIKGYGKTLKTGCLIDAYVEKYLSNIPGGKVYNMWLNCSTSTSYCGGFFC